MIQIQFTIENIYKPSTVLFQKFFFGTTSHDPLFEFVRCKLFLQFIHIIHIL